MFGRMMIAAACFAATAATAANTKWTITDVLPAWQGQALAINNRGEVSGWMYGPSAVPFHHAFVWSNGTLTDLGAPAGQYSSTGWGISNNGYVGRRRQPR